MKTADLKLCVLYEHELRIAAKLLRQLQDAKKEDIPALAVDALNACNIALYGLTDEFSLTMISSIPKNKLLKRIES